MNSILTFHTLLFLISMSTITYGQTIPNSGFENWTYDIWSNDNPDNWEHSNGDFQGAKIIKSNGYQGNWALGAVNLWGGMFAFAKSKFPVISHPSSLNAFVKTSFSNNDSVNIEIFIYHNGLAVDSGKWENTSLSSITSWTPISIPITQFALNADSAEIRINGGVEPGTSLYVDELSFSFTTDINENSQNDNLIIFPNPFSTKTTLRINTLLDSATLTVYSAFGQKVKQINISGQTYILQRDNFPNGLYFIQLTHDNKIIFNDKLIITN